jgi:hypothetical protein
VLLDLLSRTSPTTGGHKKQPPDMYSAQYGMVPGPGSDGAVHSAYCCSAESVSMTFRTQAKWYCCAAKKRELRLVSSGQGTARCIASTT